jgi:hypothetical protein
MATFINSFLRPATPQAKYLLEDIYLKGGMQVAPTVEYMNEMHNAKRKSGMFVVVQEGGNQLYQLQADNTFQVANLSQNAGVLRQTIALAPGPLNADQSIDLEAIMGKTVMLLDVSVNIANIQIDCHQTVARNDENPYRFVSQSSRLSDTGTSEDVKGVSVRKRRFSFLANGDNPVTNAAHWRIRNNNAVAVTPIINVSFITLEL